MHLDSLIKYTTLAATTAEEMASSFQVPFLASTATLVLSILNCVKSIRTNRDECVKIVEQIHEILCTIVKLYTTSEIKGVLPTALLYEIAQFTEILQKIFTSLRAQEGMGKIRRLWTQASNATRLEAYNLELNYVLENFRARASGFVVSQMLEMRRDAKQQHEELVALLATRPDLTNSDRSSLTGSLPRLGNSSGSLSMLPPSPKIFHGRESELEDVINILVQDSARIALLGAGGMGKTSLAAAALHNSDVEAKYPQRHFIPCHSAPTCAELLSNIADHIGVDKGANLAKKIVHYFANASPCLVVLDNLETPWESLRSRPAVEEFLSLLTDIPHLALMITLRGAERPAKVKWTRPFLAPLRPLSGTAALQTFMDVADDTHDKDSVKQLLDLTGNLPLAVSLIANVAASEGCDKALFRWKAESTQMLSDGYDQTSSLNISIMLSFTSPRMTPGAQDLLSILSMLPDGFTDTDLVQSKLPIINIFACKTTLIRTSLAFIDKDQRLKVLVPIREYILSIYPPTSILKLTLRQHFHELLDLWDRFQTLKIQDIVVQISQNLGNLSSVLSDALSTACSDSFQNYQSILNLNRFYGKTQQTFSPLLLDLAIPMAHAENHPVFGDYLITCVESSFYGPVINPEVQIARGNQYFQAMDVLQQAKWHQALGYHLCFGKSDLAGGLECCQKALTLSESTGYPTAVGLSALCRMSNIMLNMGKSVGAYEYAEKAQEYADYLGDVHEQTRSAWLRARCQIIFSDYRTAQIHLKNARDLVNSCGLQDSAVAILLHGLDGKIHMLKTEYLQAREAHHLQLALTYTLQPTAYLSIVANLHIAFIDTRTGADPRVVQQVLHTCRDRIQGVYGLLKTELSLLADHIYAESKLREGDYNMARSAFAQCVASCREVSMEEALLCLEVLADLSTEINDLPTTHRWAGVFLGMALRVKGKLAMMKAFSCLGQLFVAEGDDHTALSLFTVALDGFTFMDIHCWRANCMERIADIMERRGEVMKSIALWKSAKPLFQMSSQAQDMARIDTKLAAFDRRLLQEYENSLALLTDLNVPSEVLGVEHLEDMHEECRDEDTVEEQKRVPISILV